MKKFFSKLFRLIKVIVILAIVTCVAIAGFKLYENLKENNLQDGGQLAGTDTGITSDELTDVEYNGTLAIEVDDNVPNFTKEDKARAGSMFEEYSELDELGRCGTAFADICWDQMPHGGERESLQSVTPSGWQRINFWTRSHLIGYQLAGEQANEKNLIAGTSYMNATGMLEYENEVASWIRTGWGRHVLYRVTPVFAGNELVARGVQMEAWSADDNGKSISFNVFVFNYQPGYRIDYSDGTVSKLAKYTSNIRLKNATVDYTGRPVELDIAEVTGSTGEVKYIFYIDSDAKVKTNQSDGSEYDGTAPSERGTYYVRAIVKEDAWYSNASSNVAKLVIK